LIDSTKKVDVINHIADAGAMAQIPRETIGLLIGRANRQILQAVAALCLPHGLTPQQLWILLMLGGGQVRTGSDISAAVPLDKAAASRLIDGLIAEGWVSAKAARTDRRRQLLQLTAEGKRMAARLGREAAELNARMLRGLTAGDVAALGDGLRLLIANLS
jgi:DNA-binding MarR family transcriptional regulator